MSNTKNPGNTSTEYNFLVIGGGSGGITSAKRAAQLYSAKVGGKLTEYSSTTFLY